VYTFVGGHSVFKHKIENVIIKNIIEEKLIRKRVRNPLMKYLRIIKILSKLICGTKRPTS
jgi:hypothetical protein